MLSLTPHSLHPAFEDGTDTRFRNVGQLQIDAGEIPKRTYTKPLLASSCLSVCMSAFIGAAPTWWISVHFNIGNFYEPLSRTNLFKSGRKYRTKDMYFLLLPVIRTGHTSTVVKQHDIYIVDSDISSTVVFTMWPWSRERATILPYIHTVCLVSDMNLVFQTIPPT